MYVHTCGNNTLAASSFPYDIKCGTGMVDIGVLRIWPYRIEGGRLRLLVDTALPPWLICGLEGGISAVTHPPRPPPLTFHISFSLILYHECVTDVTREGREFKYSCLCGLANFGARSHRPLCI